MNRYPVEKVYLFVGMNEYAKGILMHIESLLIGEQGRIGPVAGHRQCHECEFDNFSIQSFVDINFQCDWIYPYQSRKSKIYKFAVTAAVVYEHLPYLNPCSVYVLL